MNSKQREELQRISAAITVNTLSNGVRTIACQISPEEVKHIVDTILAEPLRNCDRYKSEYDYDKLHEAFVKHCDSCNCPMGCIHRRDTRCMLDTRCGSILKCFAKFVLAEAKGDEK